MILSKSVSNSVINSEQLTQNEIYYTFSYTS